MEMCGEVTGSDFGRQGKRGEACVKKKASLYNKDKRGCVVNTPREILNPATQQYNIYIKY